MLADETHGNTKNISLAVGANGYPIWHDYVMGTDPNDTNDVFKASISFEGEKHVVTWTPDLGTRRSYK